MGGVAPANKERSYNSKLGMQRAALRVHDVISKRTPRPKIWSSEAN